MFIMPVHAPEVTAVDELDDTKRGDKGFGSTGTHAKPDSRAMAVACAEDKCEASSVEDFRAEHESDAQQAHVFVVSAGPESTQ